MAKATSVELYNSLLSMYEGACLKYYDDPSEETLKAVIDAEHTCVDNNIRRSELTKIRFTVKNALEAKNEQ